jgi:hypothetical protein
MGARIAAATEIDLVGSYRIRFDIERPSRFQPVRSAVMIVTMAGYAFGSGTPYGPMKAMGFAKGSTHPTSYGPFQLKNRRYFLQHSRMKYPAKFVKASPITCNLFSTSSAPAAIF